MISLYRFTLLLCASLLLTGCPSDDSDNQSNKDTIQIALLYPPANALTDARVTTIRGTSSQTLPDLTVNGAAVTSADNFLSWTVTLPIAELDTLALNPATSMQLDVNKKLEYKNFTRTITHSKPFLVEHESLTAFANSVYLVNESNKQVIQHNLITDERNIIFQATTDFDFEPDHAIVDDANNRLIIAGTLETDVETFGLTVVALDLTNLTTAVLFQDTRYEAFESIAFNGDNNKLLLPDWHSNGAIYEIDLTTGVKTELYSAKKDFGIKLDRGYELKYQQGDLLWGAVGSPTLHKINQATDEMSLIWQQSDYQAAIDSLGVYLRFYEDFIYDEDHNKLTLIISEGVITFDLTLMTIESYVDFASVIEGFDEVESAYILGRDVHIWDEDAQMATTYNLDNGQYTSTGNASINIALAPYPRSIGLSSDETSLYYGSDDLPAMYRLPIDASDASQLETAFDLSINNDLDGQPNFYFQPYVHIAPNESGFYMNKPYSDDGLYYFEFETLNINAVSLVEEIDEQLAIDFANNLAFTVTDDSYWDGSNFIDEIIWKKINLENGEITNIVTNQDYIGTEFDYSNIDALTLSPDGASLIAETNNNLIKISTSDGELSWLSKDQLMPNLSSTSIESLFWANDALIAINGNANSGIYKVHPSTGAFTEISGQFAGSGATPFDFDSGVYSSRLQQFFILDEDLRAIYAIDDVTGERLIIHK